jgi:hypothetical protein
LVESQAHHQSDRPTAVENLNSEPRF